MHDPDRFELWVKEYKFECFYQQGTYVEGLWQKSSKGELHAVVCKCGRGVIASCLDDAVDKLKVSYWRVQPNEHWHWEDTLRFNIILASDGRWIMGTIKLPDLLADEPHNNSPK